MVRSRWGLSYALGVIDDPLQRQPHRLAKYNLTCNCEVCRPFRRRWRDERGRQRRLAERDGGLSDA